MCSGEGFDSCLVPAWSPEGDGAFSGACGGDTEDEVHVAFLLQGVLLPVHLPQPSSEQGLHGGNNFGPSNGPCP